MLNMVSASIPPGNPPPPPPATPSDVSVAAGGAAAVVDVQGWRRLGWRQMVAGLIRWRQWWWLEAGLQAARLWLMVGQRET